MLDNLKMARPLEPIPVLKGEDALNFLKEKARIESLRPADEEYVRRVEFFSKCMEQTGKIKVVRE